MPIPVKKRNMTLQGFVKRADKSTHPGRFLDEHKDWVLQFFPKAQVVYKDVQSNSITADIGLKSIRDMAWQDFLKQTGISIEESLKKKYTPSNIQLNFTVDIVNEAGEIQLNDALKPLTKQFISEFSSYSWANRKLDYGSPGWRAEVKDNHSKYRKTITRQQAIYSQHKLMKK